MSAISRPAGKPSRSCSGGSHALPATTPTTVTTWPLDRKESYANPPQNARCQRKRNVNASTAVDVPLDETYNRRWIALAVIVVAQFMVVLDVAIVNVALPSIKTDLNFSEQNLQWVITAYSILFGGVLLLGGRLADLLGRRRLFIAGLVLFTVSSLLDGLAWSEGSLIAFRSLQGLGAAMLSPAALSILTTMFAEGRERNIALGIWGAASGSGGPAGVLLGGPLP